jgi:hypothetical protein
MKFISKHKIPWNLVLSTSKKDLCPMTKIGYYLKAVTDVDDSEILKQIDVTKIWISKETEEKLDKAIFEYLYLQCKNKKEAQSNLGWYKLNVGPAVDIISDFNLETDYIYLTENYIKEKKWN